MDNLRIDSHKLIYHVPRVCAWLQGKRTYPIYIEIGLYGGCNHRCIFCAFDYLAYAPQMQDERCLKKFIAEAAGRGVKSILYSGEGEPLLHPAACEIIAFTRKAGIDAALVTNGVFFTPQTALRTLKNLAWVKVSLDAATAGTHALVHGTKPGDFGKAIANIKDAVRIRNKHKLACTIGVQFLLIPANRHEAVSFARRMREIGADYAVIKPYCQHPTSTHALKASFDSASLAQLEKELCALGTRRFSVVFRRNAMLKMRGTKPYRRCFGLDFAAHVSAEGEVYPCNAFVGRKDFAIGNICKDTFARIWEGALRRTVMRRIGHAWEIERCRDACRLDEINRYLWDLKHPGKHVNFI